MLSLSRLDIFISCLIAVKCYGTNGTMSYFEEVYYYTNIMDRCSNILDASEWKGQLQRG